MIWATVSSQSFFAGCRVSPSLAAKNITNLILVLTIWWCPCIVFSCVLGSGCLLLSVCSLGRTLLAFALLHFVLEDQTCLFLQVSLEFFLLYSSPYDEKDIFFFFGVSSRMSYRSSQNHSTSASLGLGGWGIDLDYCNIEWFALEMNRDHSVIFEIAPKYCISDSCCLWGLLHYF